MPVSIEVYQMAIDKIKRLEDELDVLLMKWCYYCPTAVIRAETIRDLGITEEEYEAMEDRSYKRLFGQDRPKNTTTT